MRVQRRFSDPGAPWAGAGSKAAEEQGNPGVFPTWLQLPCEVRGSDTVGGLLRAPASVRAGQSGLVWAVSCLVTVPHPPGLVGAEAR